MNYDSNSRRVAQEIFNGQTYENTRGPTTGMSIGPGGLVMNHHSISAPSDPIMGMTRKEPQTPEQIARQKAEQLREQAETMRQRAINDEETIEDMIAAVAKLRENAATYDSAAAIIEDAVRGISSSLEG